VQHYVNAFLNSDGGTLYFGIDDDGRVLGVPLNRKQRDHLRLRIDTIVSGTLATTAHATPRHQPPPATSHHHHRRRRR
jgi:predicted HTH transcriptional regulator